MAGMAGIFIIRTQGDFTLPGWFSDFPSLFICFLYAHFAIRNFCFMFFAVLAIITSRPESW